MPQATDMYTRARKTRYKIIIRGLIRRVLWFCEDIYVGSRAKSVRVDRPIFLIGAPRSGTSRLYKYLCKVMPVAYFAKASSALYPIRMLRSYPIATSRLPKSIFRQKVKPIEGDHIWNVFLPTKNHCTGEKTASPDAIRFYHKKVKSYLWYFGKTRFLNKCPRHIVRIPYLNSIFPDALFIHIIRDGRAVARSVLEKSRKYRVKFWGAKPKDWKSLVNKEDVVTCALQWKWLVEEARRRSHDLGSRYLEVRYEDFVANPHKVITEISEFCDIPVDLGRADLGNLKNMNYKWKRDLNERQKKLLEKHIGTFLRNLGYL